MTLITGGAGFIGSALVRRLSTEGRPVRVLDDFSTGRADRIAGLPGVEVLAGDVRDPLAVREAVSGARSVAHLAAVASVPGAEANPRRALRVNVGGTLTVLEEARRAGVSALAYASTCAVYGDRRENPIPEDAPPAPASTYAIGKLAGERHVLLWHRTGGPSAIALRLFNVYGPGQPANSSYSGVIARFSEAARTGAPAEIHGDGSQARDFVYVADVVEAFRLALDRAPSAGGVALNVATGRASGVLETWRRIQACSPGRPAPPPRHGPPRPGDLRGAAGDSRLAEAVLGFRAATGLAEGIRRTLVSEIR